MSEALAQTDNSVYRCFERENEIPEGVPLSAASSGDALNLLPGQRVVWIGNTFIERMQEYGHLETEIHALHPNHKLVIRNLAWSGDTVSLRPRPHNFGDVQSYLEKIEADVILAGYGLNETWDYDGESGLPRFEADLKSYLTKLRSQKYNGKTAPELVLLSPIACEDSGVVPDAGERNRLLRLYAAAMARVAEEQGVRFVDLFTPSFAAMSGASRLTLNGIHLTPEGYAKLAPIFAKAIFGKTARLDTEPRALIRREVLRKNRTFFDHYRAVNSVHIHGQRVRPFGSVNFPAEREKLMQMTRLRDARIWDAAAGQALPDEVDDSGTRKIPATIPEQANLPPMPTPREAEANFVLAEGFDLNLFASEAEFPDLRNPSAMLFDARGRLWISTMPSYPHALPGVPPDDKILIFEDTDADGKADEQTVFADGLYLPLGFEIGYGGAFVSQEPNLVFLKDTDGDGKADQRTILLSGFGTEDSHHAIHDFVWGPGGGLYMQESVFLHSQIETPYGPRRLVDAGMFRFDPRTQRLEIPFRLRGGGNAWGHAIDRWGAHLWVGKYLNPAFVKQDYPGFRPAQRNITGDNRFCNQEFITSRHFPDELQGKVFSNIYKHYHGLRLHDWTEGGSSYKHGKLTDVLRSKSTSHIPVDLCLGPDGALYITDWCNQVLGHMQASLREIKRDHDHGRIWRITYKDRPLATPSNLVGRPLPELLDFLKAYEDRTRYRARRLLWEAPEVELKPALTQWVAALDPAHADVDLHRMEALWLHQQRGWINPELLETVLTSERANARAAATDLIRFWWQDLPEAHGQLLRSAADPSPKVRLAAVVSATWASADIAIATLDAVDRGPKDPDLTDAVGNARKAMKSLLKSDPLLAEPVDLATMDMSRKVANAIKRRSDLPVEFRLRALEFLARNTSALSGLLAIITELDETRDPNLIHWLKMLEPSAPSANIAATVKGLEISAGHPAIAKAEVDSITISIPGPGKIINLSELKIYSNGKDVASSATFQMSSQHDRFAPGNLVDGDTATFAHTSNSTEHSPSIKATFSPALKGIDAIKIINRPAHSSRFEGGLVTVSHEGRQLMAATVTLNPSRGGNVSLSRSFHRISDRLNKELRASGKQLYDTLTPGLQPPTRQALIAASLRAGHPVAVKDADYLYSSALLAAPERTHFTDFAHEVLTDLNASMELRQAALFALGRIPGDNESLFDQLASYLSDDQLAAAAAEALRARTSSNWPHSKAVALLQPQFERLQDTPVEQRNETHFIERSKLLREIADLDGAGISRESIDALQLHHIEIGTKPGLLQFSTSAFTVQAGAPIALTFNNDDAIDHNLVIIAPNSFDKVGLASDAMAANPNGLARHWVPDLPEVLHYTPVVKPQASHTLIFTAPITPGQYPFICSVPGHWRLMKGIMFVR
ncbi:MAG: PVC-type heme-binding CxxCH protein [Verrucomicrobiota bacterium]